MKLSKVLVISLLFCFLSPPAFAVTTLNYNRSKAVLYADTYCKNYNTDKNNDIAYTSFTGRDCANFMSQALIAGGLNFSCVKSAAIIGIGKKNKGEKGIIGANNLVSVLRNSFCFKAVSRAEAKGGDIISWGGHVGMLNGSGYYAAHTTDTCFLESKKPYDSPTYYQFQDEEKCKKCEQDEKTCKAEMKDKCNSKCDTCNPITGTVTPKCQNVAGGRCGARVNCDTQTGNCITSPAGNICADDTFMVGTGFSAEPVPSTSATASVGILEVGYTYDMYGLLQSFKEDARVIRPADISPTLVKEMPLLIIPSAGLYGMNNSEFFKAVLDEYVKKGGNILVLSQQYGYEFSVIPGGLSGYGWVEDQHCQTNSSYIDTWHNVLAGQTRSTPSLNVDGYFTKYPENTTVILRRTINGQPAVLMYPYGNGYVIASTIYTDTAYTRGEASEDEKRLIRDIVAWAKAPASLTEIKPGETATINLTVTNNDTSETATAAEIELYDPDRKEVKLRTKVPVSLAPGQNTQIPISYTTAATDPTGIYHIKYDLLTEGYQTLTSEEEPEGVDVWLEYLLQPPIESPSGRFIVSNPPSSPVQVAQLTFSLQSDSENYAYGSTATFTIVAFNNSDIERTVTAEGELGSKTLFVPAKSSSSFTHSKTVYGQGWFTASFYNENNIFLASRSKTYFAHWPSVNVDLKTNKTLYAKGETVTINAALKNNTVLSGQHEVKITITDPKNTKVFENTKTVSLSSYGTGTVTTSFILPTTLAFGYYTIRIEAWYGTRLVSSASTSFELPQSQVSITPNLPSAFIQGSNNISFNLSNIGKISVYAGTLDISLKNPEGVIVYTGSQSFTLGVGKNITLDFPISILPLKFGNYTLTYIQSDETRIGQPSTMAIPNRSSINISLDKATYKIGETANITITINNSGKFRQDGIVTANIPFLGFTDTKTITVNPSEEYKISYSQLLPLTLNTGGEIHATFNDSSGNTLAKTMPLTIAYVGIGQNIVFDKTSYKIRENLGIKYAIENNGNFVSPLNATFSLSIPDINYAYDSALTIEPGKAIEIPFTIPIPETLPVGYHQVLTSIALPSGAVHNSSFGFTIPESHLIVRGPVTSTFTAGDTINLTMENSGGVDTTYTTERLSITDIKGTVIYQGSVTGTVLVGEKKTLIDIQIPSQTAQGRVYLDVRIKDTKTGTLSYLYNTLEITGLTTTLQTRTDKETYLKTETITGISSILNGHFGIESGTLKIEVNKAQAFGGGGQFTHFIPKGWWSLSSAWTWSPLGVATGSDGSIYVTDTPNSRILKFDKNGRLITYWGSYGSNVGELDWPYGIAVGPGGVVYVADTDNHRIVKYDTSGNLLSVIGKLGGGDGQFEWPCSIAVEPNGSFYVTECYGWRIQKFDSNGSFIASWDVSDFFTPYGVAVGSDGFVYVGVSRGRWGGTYDHGVQKFDGNGNFIAKWGTYGSGDGQFSDPVSIAVDHNGYVYVVDYGNSRIQKFDSNGNFITKWGGSGVNDGQFQFEFLALSAISVGADNSIFVADTNNNRIQKFDSNGNFITKWGNIGSSDGVFNFPTDVDINPEGFVYVVDSSNNRIQKFDSSGNFILNWGGLGSGDGQFSSPWEIAIASDGSVYVVDNGNNRIQKFDSNGNFITKWTGYGYDSPRGYIYEKFAYPFGIAIASDGSVYVADSGNHQIVKFDGSGNFIKGFGSYCQIDSNRDGLPDRTCNGRLFAWPYDVVVAADGSIYVADSGNSRIQKFDSNGNFIAMWGSYCVIDPDNDGVSDNTCGDSEFGSTDNVAIGADGSVYVVDGTNNRILRFDSNGNFMAKTGTYCYTDTYWETIPSPPCGDGQFAWPLGIGIASEGSVYVADTFNNRIQKMMPSGGGTEKIFETTIPITQSANTTQDYTTNIGTLNATGKLYLQAELKNNLGQTIATSEYPFYIIEGNTLLLFSTDKKVYKLGEPVTITGEVKNLAAITATALSLQLSANSQTLYTATFDLPANGSYPFTVTTTASPEGTYTLSGKVTQNNSTLVEITDQYEVASPKVTVSVTAPEVAGNEQFNINVEMKNEGKVSAVISLQSSVDSQIQTITIPAGETKTIQYQQQIISNTTYTFTFTGDLEQTVQKTVLFGEKAELNLDIQSLYKEGGITIVYSITNTGLLGADYPATFTLFRDGQELSKITESFILPIDRSSSGSISYNLNEGLYTLRYETTGFQAETQISVVRPRQGTITLNTNDIYPEGTVNIPYTIINTGQFDADFTVEFGLNSTIISRNAFIAAGETYTDTVLYSLAAGEYTISATITSYPSVPVSKNLKVLKENNVSMDMTIGSQTNELIPITVSLTNNGYNEINGGIQLSVVSSQGTVVWNGSQDVSLPCSLSPTPYTLIFNMNISAIEPGDYILKAELLNSSNQQIAVNRQTITIKGATFQITQLPSYQTFTVGQEATFTFKVKNIGNQEGSASLAFKAYDLINSTRTEWLKPGEEKEIAFSFMLPEDLEEKDYFADYDLGDSPDSTALQAGKSGTVPTRGQVKYHIEGINLNVNATLDKQYYSDGETAHLTLVVSRQQAVGSSLNLFARVNYNGYENQQSFTLTSTSTLTFDIPLTQITGEKLFYGIYHESGRSIHLNSLYIYKAGDVIAITTDKQVYNPGETVSVTANSVSGIIGTMTLSGPNYTETFDFTGTTTKSFSLPTTMTAGTYYISAQLSAVSGETYTASHAIDVAGIQVKVLECKNDKGKYASTDTITTNFTISSNTNMPAVLKAWIVDPEGKYTSVGEQSINLTSTENLLLTSAFSLLTSASGIHRLVYGIYGGDLLLVSGSEALDVGDAVLLGLSSDKTDYPTNSETVTVTVSMFGTVDASLELQLDGTTVKNEAVSLNGFTTLNFELGTIKPGTHVLKGILTAGGLKSAKEISFVYGSNLPDLRAVVSSQQSVVSKNSTMQITATIMNQGKTPSGATTISLYDNDVLIETKTVNALNSSESEEITFIWNVLGKAGEHKIKAVVDPDNTVTEFNEENNTATMNILIPDIVLTTETDKGIYKIRQRVNITSAITNLTSTKTYQNLILTTSAKDPSGTEVYNTSIILDAIQPSSTITHTETWNTTGLPVDGTYAITQTITSATEFIAHSSKLIALEKAPDFTIRIDTDYEKIKQGERATYTAYIEPVNEWNSGVTLSMEGLPSGTSVSFTPGNLIPHGNALAVIITTDATPAGTHNLSLIAEGIDEGEVVTHAIPLTLDVSGFGLSTGQSSQTIKQLDTATFEINIASFNSYEGEVNLNVEGVPFGVRASFESWDSPDSTALQAGKSGTVPVISVPGSAKLTVLTSKYVRPGVYSLTITGDDGLVKHRLNLDLSLLPNPQIAAGIITAQGPGPNNKARTKAFNPDLQIVLDITAFDTKYGAYVTGADIDGDGYDEIIVSQGPDPKNTATLKAFKRNGTLMAEYTPFNTKYGLTLASGDLDGDWRDELIVGMGPDPKNPATLKVLKYNGSGFDEFMTQTVFDTKYGLNTATGDIDGDGTPEIITAPGHGPNNPATVTIWKQDGQNLIELHSFEAFEGNYGANVATGDIDGDGKAEIITATGPDPKNAAIVRAYKADGTLIMELRPYDSKYGYGVTVAAGDINRDGIDDIITGLGPGPQNISWVKVFKLDGTEIGSFLAYSEGIKYGVKVFSGKVGN